MNKTNPTVSGIDLMPHEVANGTKTIHPRTGQICRVSGRDTRNADHWVEIWWKLPFQEWNAQDKDPCNLEKGIRSCWFRQDELEFIM